MSILGRGRGRGRRGRRTTFLTVAGTLMAYQVLALIGAVPASAVVSCTYNAGALIITTDGADNVDMQVNDAPPGVEEAVLINGLDTSLACAAGTVATVDSTNTITLQATGDFTNVFQILLVDTGGSTTDWGDIDWTINLGTGANDTLNIRNDFPVSADEDDVSITLGASGVDLNTDANVDINGVPGGVDIFNVHGGDDDDTLWASGDETTGGPYPNAVNLRGFDGDDTIAGGAANDTLDGGFGAGELGTADWVSYAAATSAANVNLLANVGSAGGLGVDSLVPTGAAGDNSFERVAGSDHNDFLAGDDQDNRILPGSGDDTVDGNDDDADIGAACDDPVGPPPTEANACGGDAISFAGSEAAVTVDMDAETATGEGNDTFSDVENAIGSALDDMFIDYVDGDNFYRGGEGNDTFDQGVDVEDGDFDRIDGEGGVDLVDYSQRTEDLTVTLDSVFGGPGGSPTDGPCDAGSGDPDCDDGDLSNDERDDIRGVENADLGTGNDVFVGNAFNNAVNPGGGQNVMEGLGGSDFLDYAAYTVGVEVNLAGGSTAGDSASGFENVRGSGEGDTITGGTESNTIKAAGGKDNVRAGSGDDTVKGGAGNDAIRGGSGDDDLFGAGGNDKLWGGSGDDYCKGGKGKDVAFDCEAGKV